MSARILQGDCRAVMATLPEASVDACVTDPPYELTSARPGGRSEATRGAVMGGFMGMKWDGTGVAFDPETWRQALRVLKPGGYLLAFGGTRTYHRMVCAIEAAGFEIRDQLAWLYGSGFPKGTDKAKIPEEWRGWNTALKPALEPIVLARKPMVGTLTENLQRHGTGALWIDGCRIALDGETITVSGKGALPCRHDVDAPRVGAPITQRDADLGRWPANVIHDGSDEVLAAFPQTASGKQAAGGHIRNSDKTRNAYGAFEGQRCEGDVLYGDTGSAARFFYCAKADRADRNEGLDGMPERPLLWSSGEQSPGSFQSPNTHRAARNHHPTVKPTDLMRWLCRLVTPPRGTLLDPFMGSGSTLKAAELEGFSAIGIELDTEYIEIARRRIAADTPLLADVAVA
jgi:site-specific DNA-methyltransferase (adenine-specific)